MAHDPEKFLYDIQDSCQFLNDFCKGRTLENFRKDRGFRSAVERELQKIGEAIFQLNKIDSDLAEKIRECRRIIDFRHILVHGYDALQPDIVWAIITDKLTPLI